MDNLKGNDNYNTNLPTTPAPAYTSPAPGTQVPLTTYPNVPYNQANNYPGTTPYPNAVYTNAPRQSSFNQRRCLYICCALITLKLIIILVVVGVVLHWGRSCWTDADGYRYCN